MRSSSVFRSRSCEWMLVFCSQLLLVISVRTTPFSGGDQDKIKFDAKITNWTLHLFTWHNQSTVVVQVFVVIFSQTLINAGLVWGVGELQCMVTPDTVTLLWLLRKKWEGRRYHANSAAHFSLTKLLATNEWREQGHLINFLFQNVGLIVQTLSKRFKCWHVEM